MARSKTVQRPGVLSFGRDIPSEFGVSVFQIATGVFGAAAALLAARRLAAAPDSIPLGALVVPVGVAGISTVLGALMLPTG